MSDDRLRLAFAGLHPDRAWELRERFDGARGALRAIERGRVKASDHVREAAGMDAATRRAQVASLGVSLLFRGESDYPAHLDRYEDAPDLLFVRGRLPQQPGVAIVGTRRCTSYGLELARAYGRAAADAGWPVISGLARGIDGEAHRGVVDVGGVGSSYSAAASTSPTRGNMSVSVNRSSTPEVRSSPNTRQEHRRMGGGSRLEAARYDATPIQSRHPHRCWKGRPRRR